MSEPIHEWKSEEARGVEKLTELLNRLEREGFTIRDVLSTATFERHQPLIYTVVAVRESPIPLPPAPTS